ncbi:MAG: hypothetical protein KAW01_03890 [Deltaproteobacteria bacterium]|nr:hypothetical protein [Deltaproteobacteria bacterium]
METSVPVVVATISQSLATFIKQELAETNVTVQLLTDPDLFFKRLKNIKPELILLDASYPTGEKSASLAESLRQELAWQDVPLVVVKTFFEPLDELFPEISPENILTQPFTRADLLTILQRVSPQAINNHRQNQDIAMTETSKKLQESDVEANQEEGIIELTDMVEEGIPLDQLPPNADHDTTLQEPTPAPATETLMDTELEEDIAFPSDAAIDELAFTTNEEMETETDLSIPDSSPATNQMVEEIDEETIEKTPETDLEAEAAPEDFTTESPEDYLTPDEEKLTTSLDAPVAAEPETARPSVVTEPETADFSRQIEGLTQEWSKKMLVSTYASMDKLIQALGDMAPTIVEQVAREIIPPLAEKIIKSEIKRLEEKIEDDHK